MTYNFTCHHENDICKVVLVSSPFINEIAHCNNHYESCLYKEPVNIQRVIEQHKNLVQVLKDNDVTILDANPMIKHACQDKLVSYTPEEVSNILFTRDPILSTPSGVIFGKCKEMVRSKETELLMHVLHFGDENDSNLEMINSLSQTRKKYIDGARSVVEGGDYIPLGKMCFIANGNRTNIEGIFELMQLDILKTEMVCVVHYPVDENMHAIHLDCYLGIVGNRHAVVWDYAMKQASVSVYMKNQNGVYIPLSHTTPLETFLEMCGMEIIPITTECQQAYGCNILDLGNGKVLTQDIYVTNELIKRGYQAIYVPFDEIHKMYGGIRCATQVLHREPVE